MSSTFQSGLLRGKVAVVTGGGSGINFAIAKRLAEHGAKLAIIGRSQEKLDAATRELTSLGTEALGFSADVREYAAVARAIQHTREQLGAIDIVVCGAAGNFPPMDSKPSSTSICSGPSTLVARHSST
jgi:NAD(P)-dependent dehydrogenase (short-subunit alcohol dehydrogenase family)